MATNQPKTVTGSTNQIINQKTTKNTKKTNNQPKNQPAKKSTKSRSNQLTNQLRGIPPITKRPKIQINQPAVQWTNQTTNRQVDLKIILLKKGFITGTKYSWLSDWLFLFWVYQVDRVIQHFPDVCRLYVNKCFCVFQTFCKPVEDECDEEDGEKGWHGQ